MATVLGHLHGAGDLGARVPEAAANMPDLVKRNFTAARGEVHRIPTR